MPHGQPYAMTKAQGTAAHDQISQLLMVMLLPVALTACGRDRQRQRQAAGSPPVLSMHTLLQDLPGQQPGPIRNVGQAQSQARGAVCWLGSCGMQHPAMVPGHVPHSHAACKQYVVSLHEDKAQALCF